MLRGPSPELPGTTRLRRFRTFRFSFESGEVRSEAAVCCLRNIGHPRHPADTGMASRSFLWGTLAIGGFCAHGGGSRHRKAGSRHHTTSRIDRGAKDNPPVVLLGFELQEIYGNDIRSFRAVIPKAPAIQRSALASGRPRAIPSSTVCQGAGAS